MPLRTVGSIPISYELIGDSGRVWALTPGGRFSKDFPGVREMAQALAEEGNRVLIWDRPNCGASGVEFSGESESAMQADALAGLLRELELGPAVIAGGSAGSRVSMLTVARHPDVAAALAVWWITGGVNGLMNLGVYYCGASVDAAWEGDMGKVMALPQWQEVLERNPANRERFLAQDPAEFLATMKRWELAYCPCGDDVVPGLTREAAAAIAVPVLVFRSAASDISHPRETSEQVAAGLPTARLVEPPFEDREWMNRSEEFQRTGQQVLFVNWKLLVPQLTEWASEVLD
jgi:pimeloyl-ACP methyl ester carboxylesterase